MGKSIWIVVSAFPFLIGVVALAEFVYYVGMGISLGGEYAGIYSIISALGYFFVLVFSFLVAYFSFRRYSEEPSNSVGFLGLKKSTQWIIASLILFGACLVSFYFWITYSYLPWSIDNFLILLLGNPLLVICLGVSGMFFLVFAFLDSRTDQQVKIDEKKAGAILPYDEIKQLKQLLDMGAITQEEYEQKKKKILERI